VIAVRQIAVATRVLMSEASDDILLVSAAANAPGIWNPSPFMFADEMSFQKSPRRNPAATLRTRTICENLPRWSSKVRRPANRVKRHVRPIRNRRRTIESCSLFDCMWTKNQGGLSSISDAMLARSAKASTTKRGNRYDAKKKSKVTPFSIGGQFGERGARIACVRF